MPKNHLFQILVDAEEDPRQLRDLKGNVLATNSAGKKFFSQNKFPFSAFESPENTPALQDLTDALCLGISVCRSVHLDDSVYHVFVKRTDSFLMLGVKDISFIQEAVGFLQQQFDVSDHLLEFLPIPFLLTDSSGMILKANTCFCQILQKNKEDIENTSEELYLKPYTDTLCFFNQVLYEKKEVYFSAENSSLCGLFLLPKQEPVCDYKADNVPLPLLTIQKDLSVLRANTFFLNLFKCPEKPIKDIHLSDFFAPQMLQLLSGKLQKTPLTKTEISLYSEFLDKTFNVLITPDYIKEDCFSLYWIDISERKNLEMQVSHAQKMQAMGQMAGGVAHDFNNLLTAIIGFCDLLLQRHSTDKESFLDLMQIKNSANRASGLVGQLLTFSRKKPTQVKVLPLYDTFMDISALLSRSLSPFVKLKTDIKRTIGAIKMDPNQLTQIFLNLAVNAKEAMPQGGTFTITAQREKIKKARPCGADMIVAGEYVKFVITDTGTGISAQHLPHIFEPFFSTKKASNKSGTGLGLSTVYGIIRTVGGYISVDSEKGVGTTFFLYLPRVEETVEEQTHHTPVRSEKNITQIPCILLVDDEASIRIVTARALKAQGWTVVECNSAEQALEEMKKQTPFTLLISDVVMPGMDGETLSKHALQMNPQLKIILMSGYSEDFARHSAGENNAFTFLPKPFELKELLTTVHQVLSK